MVPEQYRQKCQNHAVWNRSHRSIQTVYKKLSKLIPLHSDILPVIKDSLTHFVRFPRFLWTDQRHRPELPSRYKAAVDLSLLRGQAAFLLPGNAEYGWLEDCRHIFLWHF